MKWLALIAATIVSSIVLNSVAYPTTTYRFRITLNVDTPQGLKSGSSVMEVRHRTYPAWTTLGNNTGDSKLTGEAVFVDLGPGDDGKPRNVIALLARGKRGEIGIDSLPTMAFEPLWKGKSLSRGTAYEMSTLPVGTRTELYGELIPTLMTFVDVSNPSTGRALSPNDFPLVLGSGTILRNAEIEIVSSGHWPFASLGFGGVPITSSLDTHLRWLDRAGRPAVVALKAAGYWLGESELAFRTK